MVGGNHHFLSSPHNTRPLNATTARPHSLYSRILHYDERGHLCPLVKYTDDKPGEDEVEEEEEEEEEEEVEGES